MKFSLVLTNYNRFKSIVGAIQEIHDMVDEVIVNDDASNKLYDGKNVHEVLTEWCKDYPNVKLYRNEKNVGAFHNKHLALEKATNDWCILLDSDNFLPRKYIQVLKNTELKENTIYNPCTSIVNGNRWEYPPRVWGKEDLKSIPREGHLFNGGNYLVPRKAYLEVSKDWLGYINYIEVAVFAYLWMKKGNYINVLKDLEYFHASSDDSFYKSHVEYHKAMKEYLVDIVDNNLELDKSRLDNINNGIWK